MKRLLFLPTFLLLLGCGSPEPIHPHDQQAIVASAVSYVALVQLDQSAPSPKPNPSGICTNCNGTGRTGDGILKCFVCNGTGRTSGPTFSVDEVKGPAERDSVQPKSEHGCVGLPAGEEGEAKPAGRTFCQCPDCGCEDCLCGPAGCQCPNCLMDYSTASRTQGRGLLVVVGPCDPNKAREKANAQGLTACRPWEGCDNGPGEYVYLWKGGRLLLDQPIKETPFRGGYMQCGPGGCRFVPQ